jgi:hypothetical protein
VTIKTTFASAALCIACLIAVLASSGCHRQTSSPTTTATAERSDPWFEDIYGQTRIDFRHVSGHRDPKHYFPEIMGSGGGLLDFDQDGLLDIFFIQSGSLYAPNDPAARNRLYRNLGDGTFRDVTDAAQVGDRGYGMGCACGDYDADGDPDIYVTNVGPNTLYRNEGDGTFTDVTAISGTGDPQWSTSAAFSDYDGDGDLDLFVANYVRWSRAGEKECVLLGQPSYCFPKNYAPAPDTLYRNRGDGTFENVTTRAGLHRADGNGLGVACGDFNGDDLSDIFVANDATVNQLWINRGDGTFTDEALIRGCAVNGQGVTQAGMGVQAVDIESDGDLDLFVTNLRAETNTLFLNRGGDFQDVTSQRGLGSPSLPFTGFGVGFADFDHDGKCDVYVANGRVVRAETQYDSADPYAEPSQLYFAKDNGHVEEILPRGGTGRSSVATSRGAAFGDIDNDGDIDIVVFNRDGQPAILHNLVGSRGNWIQFHVLNQRGSPTIGACLKYCRGEPNATALGPAGIQLLFQQRPTSSLRFSGSATSGCGPSPLA